MYPQWFIDELVNEEDKEKAKNGSLRSTDIVTFICEKGHVYKQKVCRHIIISRNEKWHGCKLCGYEKTLKKGHETRLKNLHFPQWFIDELVNEEDKEKAKNGLLSGTDVVEFHCEKGHVYKKPVNRRIKTTSMTEGKGCPTCSRKIGTILRIKNKIKNNIFPQWFIDELANEKDKEKARNSTLSSRELVEFICNHGHVYKQYVCDHIYISSMTKKYGCPICGKEKQILSRKETLCNKRSFPQWFIDDLYTEEDKQKALIGCLSSEDTVTFICKHGHVYNQRVGDHITLSTGLPKYGCLQCSHIEAIERSKKIHYDRRPPYPEWFINALVNEEDKEKAKSRTLTVLNTVVLKCPKGHLYTTKVNDVISIKDSKQRKGCPYCYKVRSYEESIIENYIISLGYSVEHSRKILPSKKELDIYIPEKNLAIEYNGSYYHCCLPKQPNIRIRKSNYHTEKFLECKSIGIHLLNIFDVDMNKNQNKIFSYIKSLLCKSQTIYARNCLIVPINKQEANYMYDKYHLLGPTPIIDISYGLYYNNELVSCMSFQKGRYKENKEPVWCLTRFVTKEELIVIGGASKLLSKFEKEYKPSVLVSYSDNDYFKGDVYFKLGFKCLGNTKSPRYYWYLKGKEIKREQCQLKNLKKIYPVLFKESENKGNREDYIMINLGALKVYRSGHTKWIKYY